MQPMKKLRLWHALLALLAVAAYLTEGEEPWHQMLGYSVAVMIAIRLLMALFGAGPLGLQRFYPKFHDLKLGTAATHPAISRVLLLGIALCLLGVTTTGVLMDQGKTFQPLSGATVGASVSPDMRSGDDDDGPLPYPRDNGDARDEDGDEGPLGEVHELLANLLIGMVALHVSYLILFKWPLARFMLFVRQPRAVPAPKTKG